MRRPGKIVAVHTNYRSRAEELGRPLPVVPDYFLKPPSALAGDGDVIVRPAGCRYLCFEGELAVVIGRRARSVTAADALSHVAGIAAANDVGLHDFLSADRGALLRVKGQDGFCPVGEIVSLADADLASVTVRTTHNGRLAQAASAAEMLFDVPYLIADLSRFMTLDPGDMLLTGTPAGSRVMTHGDEVTVELVGLSRVTSRVVDGKSVLGEPVGAQPVDGAAARTMAGADGSEKIPSDMRKATVDAADGR